MIDSSNEKVRVLAISPSYEGFGFAVFEGPEKLIDWGVGIARRSNAKRARLIAKLLKRYQPSVIVTEDCLKERSLRCRRVKRVLEKIARLTSEGEIEFKGVPRSTVKNVFYKFGASNKHEIATTITNRLPQLAPWLPKPRKPWIHEDCKMDIFDAAALALAFFVTIETENKHSDR